MITSHRALCAALALGLVAGCSGGGASSPSADDGGSSSSSGSAGDDVMGTSSADPTRPDDDPDTTTGEDPTPDPDDGTTSGPDGDSEEPPETTDGTTTGAPETTGEDDSTSGGSSSTSGAIDPSEGGSEDTGAGEETGAGGETGIAPDPFCGDGFIDAGEECDEGLANDDGGDCTSACTVNVCGDGYQHVLAEACDDGNDDSSDGCVACQPASCGDGFLHIGVETCDDANGDDLDACHNDCSAHEAVELALGGNHTCARFDSGMVKCWGNSASGRLGYGNTDNIGDDETPADVGFIDFGEGITAQSVIAGVSHTCVSLSDGTMRCFGAAAFGQLGYGNQVAIGDNEAITSVDATTFGQPIRRLGSGGGAFHSCALLEDAGVQCWGQGTTGKLGVVGETGNIGDNEPLLDGPRTDIGGTPVAFELGVAHSCAMMDSGHVRCWGSNGNGALGYGQPATIGDDETPASAGDVPLDDFAIAMGVGWYHSCAVIEGGEVQCWGRGNDGRLGYGNTAYVGFSQTPADVGTLLLDAPARTVDGGLAHTCALLADDTVQCWGFGGNGQLGYGNTDSIGDDESPSDVGVVPLSARVRTLAVDGNHTCVITTSGGVRCWGQGGEGRLGYGNTDSLGDDESIEGLGDIPMFPVAAAD